MRLSGGSSLVTITAAAINARADAPMRVILSNCDETLLEYGIIFKDVDISWLQE
jgi:hypothetical protein